MFFILLTLGGNSSRAANAYEHASAIDVDANKKWRINCLIGKRSMASVVPISVSVGFLDHALPDLNPCRAYYLTFLLATSVLICVCVTLPKYRRISSAFEISLLELTAPRICDSLVETIQLKKYVLIHQTLEPIWTSTSLVFL